MKKIAKIIVWLGGIMAVICIAIMLIFNQIVVNHAKGRVFSDIDSIKYDRVGLLLGTTPRARFDRITNYFFIYRIDAAELLYKAGKIEKILISGDEHSLDGINTRVRDKQIRLGTIECHPRHALAVPPACCRRNSMPRAQPQRS